MAKTSSPDLTIVKAVRESWLGGFVSSNVPQGSSRAAVQSGEVEPEHGSAERTYAAVCAADLRALQTALYGVDDGPASHLELVAELFRGWGDLPVPRYAPYPSRIGDDHSPFEYSVAFSPAGPELRLLFEAQAPEPSDTGNRQAALAFNRHLANRAGVDMQKFSKVEDLFFEPVAAQDFSLWHAVCLNRSVPTAFKVYMNPQTRGATQSWSLLEEAVKRLELSPETMKYVGAAFRRPGLDQLSYFSLDLSDSSKARVKIYIAHNGIRPEELDDIFCLSPGHRPGDVIEFCAAMGGGQAAFERKPLMSCMSFVGGGTTPYAMTLHLPIAHYAPSDDVAIERVRSFLAGHDLDAAAYEAAVGAIARRPLQSARGIQSYASFRREEGALRLTAYLSPELFSPLPPRKAGPSWRPGG